MDIATWLRGLGLERYAEAFQANEVTAEALPELTDADLRELGLPLGPRRVMLKAIRDLTGSPPAADPGEPARAHAAPAAKAPAPGPKAERRQLTVMFVDLVGSTALSARLDPEDMREVLRAYQDAVTGEVTRFGGHVAKLMGDGVLAYFGWPEAHEDDAERSVRAGLGVVATVGRLTVPGGEPLACRVSVATGLVVVGDLVGEGAAQEEVVVGETPNLAARLQELAGPGQVVVAEGTHQLLGGMFECAARGEHALKGLATPIRAWAVEREGTAQSRFEALHAAGLTPLVGRAQELALLLERWASAKDGEGQVVLLEGEAGIGKSRITQALTETLAVEPHLRVRYQCSPYHTDSALYPITRQLAQSVGLGEGDSPAAKLAKLEALLGQAVDNAADVAPLFARLLGIEVGERYPQLTLSPQEQRARTLDALVDQLLGLARKQPVLAVIEDVHWIDPTTLELVELALYRIASASVLLLLTARPGFQHALGGHPHVTRLTLNRLGREPSRSIVRRIAGKHALPEPVMIEILAKTDGVPLFVEELTKAVLESGLLRETDGRLVVNGPLPPLAIPATLQDSLMARLDRLALVKEVAQSAACIGREFSHALLAMVVPLPSERLDDALAQLAAAELIFRRGTYTRTSYVFKHALVQDAAYQSLLKSKRQQIHAKIAQVLSEQFPELVKTEPELLAHHYAEAGLVEQAIDFLRTAGVRAIERSTYLEAISHLTRGLELLERLPETKQRAQRELHLQISLGSALMAVKGYAAPEAGRAFSRARQLCRQAGQTPQLLQVLAGLYRYHHVRGELHEAREAGEQFLSLAPNMRDSAFLIEAHRALGVSLLWLGEVVPACTHLEEGIALYDSKVHRPHASLYSIDPGVICHSYAALAWWYLGYADRAITRSGEALALAESLSHPQSRALAFVWAAWLHQFLREPQTTAELALEAVRLTREHQFPLWMSMASILSGWSVLEGGEIETGIAEMLQGLADLRATGARLWQPCFLALLAEAHGKAGRATEGLTVLEEAFAITRQHSECFYYPELRRLRGTLLLQHQSNDSPAIEAEACFQEALKAASSYQAKFFELRASVSLARLWADRGELTKAHDLLAPVYGWFTEGFDAQDLSDARTLLDELGSSPTSSRHSGGVMHF